MPEDRGCFCLLIEDDRATAMLLTRSLERAGYHVDHAEDGGQAAAQCEQCTYDVIVCDQHLPDIEGSRWLESRRNEGTLPPAILLTADADPRLAAEVLASGVDLFLYKDAEGAYVKLLPVHIARVLEVRRCSLEAERSAHSLREQERMLTTIGDAAMDAIVVMDDRGCARFWNRAAEQMFGYTAAEALGANIHDLLVPAQWKEHARTGLGHFLATGEGPCLNRVLRLSAKCKNGCILPIEITVNALRRGRGWWSVGIIRDLSERAQIEEAMVRQAEELNYKVKALSCLFELSRLLEDTHRPLSEVLAAAVRLVAVPWRYSDAACARIVLHDRVVATEGFEETIWKIASPLMVADELVGAIEVCYRNLPPAAEEPAFTDEERQLLDALAEQLGRVIERSAADREIRELKRQIEFVLGATRTRLYIVSADRQIQYVDPMTQSAFGPFAGKICYRYLHGRETPCEECPMAAARTSGRPTTIERLLPRENDRPVQLTMIPFQDDHDRARFASILVDLSTRKAMELQLAEAKKLEAIGRLAAGIAHEINTPVQYVSDNVRFLGDAFGTIRDWAENSPPTATATAPLTSGASASKLVSFEEEQWQYLSSEIPAAIEQSLQGLEQIASIVRAMKEFSHQGARNGEKIGIDVNRLVRSAITVTRNEWKYVAEVRQELDSTAGTVVCIPGEINQVLLNLLLNAAQAIAQKFSSQERKGEIVVGTRRDSDSVEITISDNGCGIPQEHRDKVFEPFFTTKEVGKGTGQGLAIARAIVVDHHGGQIDFTSVPGEGTTFRIRLPLRSEHGQSVGLPASSVEGSQGVARHVSC